MINDFTSSSTPGGDPASCHSLSAVMPPAGKTAAVTRMRYLEHEAFDDDGHIRTGMNPARAEEIVALINGLRHALGWLEIDLDGRWRWPQ
jgi:hypothetical protein